MTKSLPASERVVISSASSSASHSVDSWARWACHLMTPMETAELFSTRFRA
ncbi:hypothetical protein [Nocardioides houyundeii]|uniref:hypothetical protein n=1 Tax=Nocardioides houyundeii TaxID=2045452 RepID=UPI0018EF5E32|nr:hypothetical protein [Nocardioides houyundeii]